MKSKKNLLGPNIVPVFLLLRSQKIRSCIVWNLLVLIYCDSAAFYRQAQTR